MKGDSHLITLKAITESSIINNLRASEHLADDQEDENNSVDEPEPTPFSTLEASKMLDRYFRIHSNSNITLCPKWSRTYQQGMPVIEQNKPTSHIFW